MEYDAYGRMTKKVADNRPLFSQAVFHPDKPHATASASTYYGLFPDGEQNITYTSFDKVKRIVQDGNTIEYAYGYDRQRIFMEEHVGSTTRTKRYLGNCELLTVTTDDDAVSTQWLTYLAGPTGVYAVVTTDTEGTHTIHYVLKDNLGSWATITDRHGNIEQELSYDPWGTRRNPDTWHTHNNQNLEAPMFDRGYTGHEHLYAFGLINMNGRMYDPLTSSFLSVDAYVQSPDNAQSFNRYAYCQNNPLRYVDPSGWYMQGASYGTPITGSSWGESYSQHAYEPRELGMLQLPENKVMTWWMEGDRMLGGGGGGGGYTTAAQLQLIRNWQDNPCRATRYELVKAGISNLTVNAIYGHFYGEKGFRNSYYYWTDGAGNTHSADVFFEYVEGSEDGFVSMSIAPLWKQGNNDVFPFIDSNNSSYPIDEFAGSIATIVGGAAKQTVYAYKAPGQPIPKSPFTKISKVSTVIGVFGLASNITYNIHQARTGMMSWEEAGIRTLVSCVELGVTFIPYVGPLLSVTLTAYDIGGGFDNNLYSLGRSKTHP